jgi:hypothetical protein
VSAAKAEPRDLATQWTAVWPDALGAWSAYTLLREPQFFESDREARPSGMAGQIAAISFDDHRVRVNLATVRKQRLEENALAVLAHEVGHHVYVPGNLTDGGRLFAAIRRMLTGLPDEASRLVANLYGDLLINDRLARRAGVDVASVYRKLRQPGATSAVWAIYTRAYEHLWRLAPGTLSPDEVSAEQDADAQLVARIVRSFAGQWLKGARRFATVLYKWLAEDEEKKRAQPYVKLGLHDAPHGGEGGEIPDGLAEIDPSEIGDEDGFDDDILDPLGERKPRDKGRNEPARGQYRQPFEYEQLLKALGLEVTEQEAAVRYYKERALPHLIPFPRRRAPQATEPLAEGWETWTAGDAVEDLDVAGSVVISPVLVPGVTTMRRVYGEVPGSDPARTPVDLDIYVDSSGSMPNPKVDVSYLALAGVILALSALRMGARVQATLWSGPNDFQTTDGFTRDEAKILTVITGFLGGATAFPLHVLRDTYATRKPSDPPAHVAVISDDGVDTILAHDEKRVAGAKIAREALERAKGGGTLVLNLGNRKLAAAPQLTEIGFRIHSVSAWEDLVAFARAFVRETYGEGRA